ncbi:unnamed protein product [Peronospora effusa]|nr:unnamed protein product [Peronospora effusa]
MRVHVQLFLAAVAITHTIKAEPTPFVGVSKNNSSTESSSTAARDKGDGMTNVNVLVKEVLAEEKTRRTIATSSSTKPSKESTYTADRDDGERIFERFSVMVANILDAVHSKVGNVVGITDILQPEGYNLFLKVATKHQKDSASAFAPLKENFDDKQIAELIVYAKTKPEHNDVVIKLEKALMEYWKKQKKSADEVFELLRLHTVEDGVLTNPVFNQWYSYFEMVNAKHGNKESVIDFLSSKKGTSFEDFMKDELEKANLGTKSRVDELFVDLRLERVGDGLFTDPLFIFWRACLEKFNGAHPKKSPNKCYPVVANRLRRLENDLFATWLSDGKSIDDVFKFLDLNHAGYKLLEDPSMETFAKFTQVVSMDNKELPRMKEARFEEHEILRGIKIASGTGGLRTTPLEKALFRLWFTQKKHPEEVYKMYFGQDKLNGILKDKGNLFEIPLFITFVKYSEGYSRTKRLSTHMAKYAYAGHEFDMSSVLQKEFEDEMDKLGEMIMSVKESSSNSVKASSSKPVKASSSKSVHDFSSKSALFAAERVEGGLFRIWNAEFLLDEVFELLKLNTKMTPAELFGNPSFRWWIDYSDFFVKQVTRTEKTGKTLMEVFEPSTNLAWLRDAREEETTKELANRVWTNLLKEHLQANTSPDVIETKLMVPPKSFHDEKVLKEYEHLYDRRKNDAEEKKKGDVKAWETNTKLQEERRKKLYERRRAKELEPKMKKEEYWK